MIRLTEGEWASFRGPLVRGTLSPGEIVSALRPKMNWRRNTVHTYLTRMESKGLVKIHRETEPHQYAAAVSREACAQQERKQLLDKVYNGAAGELIAAFLKRYRFVVQIVVPSSIPFVFISGNLYPWQKYSLASAGFRMAFPQRPRGHLPCFESLKPEPRFPALLSRI